MGQAKLRGNRDARVAEALKKIEALKPGHIVCNNCQAELTEIATLDARGIPGIETAFGAHCTTCNHNTWAVRGDPDAVANLYASMESEMGPDIKTGIATASNG